MNGPAVFDPEILEARRCQAERFPAFDPAQFPPAEARLRMNQAACFFNDGLPALPTREVAIPASAGPMRGRLYLPEPRPSPGAATLFIHGGGWFNGDVDTHDRCCRYLASESKRVVLAIDYRLAPEAPFPAGLEDARSAWDWLEGATSSLDIDPSRVALSGDSAGANLALALALTLRDGGGVVPDRLGLAYGCFAPVFDTPSQIAFGGGQFGLTTARMRWYWQAYIGEALEAPPLAAPSGADLRGLPPTYLSLGELDVLADESRLLAEKLAEAGVEHHLDGWPGAPHGFMQMTRDSALARKAVAAMARFLRA